MRSTKLRGGKPWHAISSLGVGWGGEGMGYSIVTQVETHCMILVRRRRNFLSVLHVFAPGNVISNVISRGFEVTNPQNFPPAAEFP